MGFYLCYLFLGLSPWPSAILAWSAALLLGQDWIKQRAGSILYGAGLLLLLFCWLNGVRFSAKDLFLAQFGYGWRYLPPSAR